MLGTFFEVDSREAGVLLKVAVLLCFDPIDIIQPKYIAINTLFLHLFVADIAALLIVFVIFRDYLIFWYAHSVFTFIQNHIANIFISKTTLLIVAPLHKSKRIAHFFS